jgi:methyl-accepting chemotaxis protein
MNENSSHNVRQLRTKITLWSGAGIVIASAIVACVSILPLYNQLQTKEKENLKSTVQTRTMAVEEFLSKAKNVALQITSRTRARQLLQGYNQGELEPPQFRENISPILQDALRKSDAVAGIARLGSNQRLAVSVGTQIPNEYWSIPPATSTQVSVEGPIDIQGQSYLVLGAPIVDNNENRVGTDVVLFRTRTLRRMIGNYQEELGNTGDMILASSDRTNIDLLFPLQDGSETLSEPLANVMKRAITGEQGVRELPTRSQTMAYFPVENSNWGVAVIRDNAALYGSLNKRLRNISIVIVLLAGIGSVGMVWLLRPLAGKTVLQTERLQQEIEEKNSLLQEKNQILAYQEQRKAWIDDAMERLQQLQDFAQQVAEQTATSKAQAEQALSLMDRGTKSVDATLEQMEILKDAVAQIDEQMNALNNNTGEIGTVTELVSNLANQTNMLALNAAVEAVRAGEQGKGFSVVASEIRKLADRSRQSAEKIHDLVSQIQSGIQSTTNTTESGTEAMQSGVNLSQQSAETFNGVYASLQEVVRSSQEISNSTDQQAQSIQKLVDTIQELDNNAIADSQTKSQPVENNLQ